MEPWQILKQRDLFHFESQVDGFHFPSLSCRFLRFLRSAREPGNSRKASSWSTRGLGCCPWRTRGPTPTAPSSSSARGPFWFRGHGGQGFQKGRPRAKTKNKRKRALGGVAKRGPWLLCCFFCLIIFRSVVFGVLKDPIGFWRVERESKKGRPTKM